MDILLSGASFKDTTRRDKLFFLSKFNLNVILESICLTFNLLQLNYMHAYTFLCHSRSAWTQCSFTHTYGGRAAMQGAGLLS